MEICRITRDNAGDLRLKNEPFSMPGRFVPSLREGRWGYTVEPFAQERIMTFPDEAYTFEKVDREGCAFAAYDNGVCVGLIVLKEKFWKYLYVHDLKVSASARGRGVGRALLRTAWEEAIRRDYRGLYLQAQDTNLNACLFYVKTGFVIGGYDNHLYTGTGHEGEGDVTFYLDRGYRLL